MILSYLLNLIISDSSTILIIFLISLVTFYLLKHLWDDKWLYYYSFNMDGPSPTWPIIGNALYFKGGTTDILATLIKFCKEFKSPMRSWIGNELIIGVTKPEHVKIVLNKALERAEYCKLFKPAVGEGLFTATVPLWRQHRKTISPLFNQKILNRFVDIFGEQAEILVEQAERYVGKGIFNADKILNSCSLDIICDCVLGKKIQAQTTNHYLLHIIDRGTEIICQRVFKFWLHPDFIFNLTSSKKELDQCVTQMKQFLNQIIDERRSELKQSNNNNLRDNKIFLDYIIEQSEVKNNWTDKEILDEAVTLLIGGTDTSTATDGFVLMMLGMHPDIQEKVYGELQEIFGMSNRRVTPEDLHKMNYLERVIKETLRLFPGGAVIGRAITEDIKLDNHVLPKGSNCIIGIMGLHMNPEIWAEPEKFDPDRFLPEEVAKRHPYSYLPFSGGSRDCIGRRFGMMSLKSVLSTFLRRYKIRTAYKRPSDIKIRQDVSVKSIDGYLIELEKRF